MNWMDIHTEDYSSSCTSFDYNDEGDLRQVNYANLCCMNSEPALGIVTRDGVILASEKKMQMKFALHDSINKLEEIGKTVTFAFAGLTADFRVLSHKYNKMAFDYDIAHGSEMPLDDLVDDVSITMQEATQEFGLRPYGLTLLIGAWRENEGQLYTMDCAGTTKSHRHCAVGQYMTERSSYLKMRYTARMDGEDAVTLAMETLLLGNPHLTADEIEIGIVEDVGLLRICRETIASYLKRN